MGRSFRPRFASHARASSLHASAMQRCGAYREDAAGRGVASEAGVALDLTLRRLVQSLLAQSLDVPASAPGWHETGFTAMLRVFDTVRSTLDPTFKTSDSRVRLLGEPILVMNARLSFEASNQTATDLKADPQAIAEPPALPVLHLRVGDVTRPGRRRARLLPDRRLTGGGPVRAGQPRGGGEGRPQPDGVRRLPEDREGHPSVHRRSGRRVRSRGQHRRSTPCCWPTRAAACMRPAACCRARRSSSPRTSSIRR